MNLYKLLTFHAIITFAAALVLILAPSVIPETVNIKMQQGQFLLCYFLAAAEPALAYLSFYGRKITDVSVMRVIIITMIIFHSVTLLLELVALSNGVVKNYFQYDCQSNYYSVVLLLWDNENI